MQAMMFDDSVGLTTAVLEETKNMTRREAFYGEVDNWYIDPRTGFLMAELSNGKVVKSKHHIGEVVAVAMNYEKAGVATDKIVGYKLFDSEAKPVRADEHIGWRNKMYAKAIFMPNTFTIADIKCEKLQNISDEDCLREGIKKMYYGNELWYEAFLTKVGCKAARTPKGAFEALIKKISRKGFWDSNPNVMCYSIKLNKQ